MDGQNTKVLKPLHAVAVIPQGFLLGSDWMSLNGISRQSAHQYAKSGWLEHVAHGVYRRPHSAQQPIDPTTDWKVLLLSLQWIMGYGVHLGGTSALNLEGYTHYLPLGGKEDVYLYGDVPKWVAKVPITATLHQRPASLFKDRALGIDNAEFDVDGSDERAGTPWLWPIRSSCPERAILEALDELPDRESFHNLDMLFQSLTNLRPRVLTALLQSCRKVKVKRLFFVFADKHQHAWLKHVDRSVVDFGTGDRSLVKGGRLHSVYRITVPAEFLPSGDEATDGA